MSGAFRKTVVVDGITPVGAYAALRAHSETGSFLLESVVPGERWGRYSVLGYRPRTDIAVPARVGSNPFAQLNELMPRSSEQDADIVERLLHGYVGFLSYDAVHYAHKVAPWPDSSDPLARFVGDATIIVFDNLTHTATIAALQARDLERAESELRGVRALEPLAVPDASLLPSVVDVNLDDMAYAAAVERAQEYIRAGDVFQVVPARTFSTPVDGTDPFDVYRAMRVLSPAPYMYLLELPENQGAPEVAIIGASPETSVRVEGSTITLRPIAGTRRRGRTLEEDEALALEMLDDPKEIAEHIMLMDLARNDIGRVALPGTVNVPQRLVVERYSHVMHIVSEVTGQLPANIGPWDVLAATFPAGTLSGAPKVRAMQIIRELEARPRGVYGGAIGYVTRGADLDMAIAIRTVVKRGDRFEVTAGAGIVADSVPALECKETRNKARAALAAIEAAHRNRKARET